MIRYVLKRLLMLIPVIIAVSFIVFMLMNLIPGDPMTMFSTSEMTPEEVETLRVSLGLDDPLLVRYGKYMLGVLQGDLGSSLINGYKVWNSFMERLPNTLLLTLCSFVVGVALAIPLGVFASKRAGTLADSATTVVTMVGMAMPSFWLGLLLILLFSSLLGWLPTGGFRDARSLILPAIAVSSGLTATATRQTRSSMLEILKADYLRTARAKGVPERVVIRKHALGNAMIPIVTSLGGSLCVALAGSAVVETVFAWPGIGRFVVESVFSRDITATTGTVILTTTLYCLVQLAVDLVYAFFDPRIKARYIGSVGKKKKAKRPAENMLTPELAPAAAFAEPIPIGAPLEAIAWQPLVASAVGTEDVVTEDLYIDTSILDSEEDQYDAVEEQTAVSDSLITRKYKKRSQFGTIFHNLRKSPGAVIGMILIAVVVILFIWSLFVPFEAVSSAIVKDRFSAPSLKYPFGTDNLGRNLFSRCVYAARFSLPIGLGATIFGALFGIFLGSLASYYGGKTDGIIMRCCDTLASIPSLIIGMVIVTALGRSLPNLIIAIGIGTIPGFIRTSRGAILSVRDNEFVEAARSIGLSNFRIIFTEVLPNAIAPVMISFSISLGVTILSSAALSFLGFGIPVPYPEWGSLVSAGRDYIRAAPWLTAFQIGRASCRERV